MVTRYNLYPAAPVNGATRPGVSSGQAIELMDAPCPRDPRHTMKTEWTELTLNADQGGRHRHVRLCPGGRASCSWRWPRCMKVGPCRWQSSSWCRCVCSVCSSAWRCAAWTFDVFVQIGFVVLVGLACKNAILIVEFAKAQGEAGMGRFQATTEACRLRLRPILMTSFAFILGVVPLVVAHEGGGRDGRRSLGTAVFSGMLGRDPVRRPAHARLLLRHRRARRVGCRSA